MVLRRVGCAAFALAMFHARAARAESPCFDAFTSGQRLALAGKVVEARARFAACLADATCPAAPLLRDCESQRAAADARVASIVVSAADGATAGRLALDGVAISDTLDGKAIDVDPGPHHVVVERGASRASIDVLVPEGAKLKQVVVAFPVAPRAAPLALEHKTSRVPAWIVGITGVALAAAFGAIAIHGQLTYDDCAAHGCGAATTNMLRVEQPLAWTLAGVSAAALIASGVLFVVKF